MEAAFGICESGVHESKTKANTDFVGAEEIFAGFTRLSRGRDPDRRRRKPRWPDRRA
jgi:hypothetical protein